MKKLMFVFIIGAALVWFGMDYYKKNNTSDKKAGGRGASRQVVVAVETGSVTKGDMNDEGIFTGSIQPKSKFQVAPKTSGRIKKVNFDIGDTIKNGDIVAELDDEEFILAVEQAEAALEIAKANYNESGELLEISKRELERVKTMRKQKVASEVEVENASADYKTRSAKHMVNKSSLRQAEASLAQAKLKLAYTKVDASWSYGVNDRFVSERLLDEGAMITANTPIISVIDITNLTVVIDVVERDYF
ncbi:MAG: efflux RND transporter periplasmic adaptor subunit, partial [Candidatus Riflebacteria bacterium]|nr:efflux RND transporter periplasmic adaptor subunit [Candidatus Riflebacteria bacterium]